MSKYQMASQILMTMKFAVARTRYTKISSHTLILSDGLITVNPPALFSLKNSSQGGGLTSSRLSTIIVANGIKRCNLVISIRQPDDLVTVPEAARRLGHHKTTLYRWWRAKKLYLVELGGILFAPISEIERLKKEQSHPGSPRSIMGLLPKFEKVLREYLEQTD